MGVEEEFIFRTVILGLFVEVDSEGCPAQTVIDTAELGEGRCENLSTRRIILYVFNVLID
jgi:hypothetical protein